MKKQIITIVGGGSSAHTLIHFLTDNTREINLLTSKPKEWITSIILRLRNYDD